MRTILVDGRPLVRSLSGIGRFTLDAANALAARHRLVVATGCEIPAETKAQLHEGIETLCRPMPVRPDNRVLWLYGRMPGLARKVRPDIYWNPVGDLHPFGVPAGLKVLTTFHDLVQKDHPGTMLPQDRLLKALQFRKTLGATDVAWCVSRFTHGRLLHHYPRFAGKVVVGSCIRPDFFRPSGEENGGAGVAAKIGVPPGRRVLLFVGNLEPRKNLGFLLELMPRLREHGYLLVAVGCKAWESSVLFEQASRSVAADEALFPGYVDDEALRGLYREAEMFVSASLYEGFGLPQLEAMTSGCPVVTADNSGMAEVVGEGGRLVPGFSPEAWIEAILAVSEGREACRRAALERAGEFSWRQVVERVAKALDEA